MFRGWSRQSPRSLMAGVRDLPSIGWRTPDRSGGNPIPSIGAPSSSRGSTGVKLPRRRGRTSTTRPGGRRCPSSPGRAARGWPAPSTMTIHAEAVPNSCTNTPRPALARPQPHVRDYPEVTILCASCLAASPWPPAATAWLTNAGVSTTVTRWWWWWWCWSAERRLVGLNVMPDGTGQITGRYLVEMPG
jgi:hypothetical protein